MLHSGGGIYWRGAAALMAALALGACSAGDGPSAPKALPAQPQMGFLASPPSWQTTPRTAEREMLEVCYDVEGGASGSSGADFAVAGTLTSGASASSNGGFTLADAQCKEVFFSGYGESWLVNLGIEDGGSEASVTPIKLTFDDLTCSAWGTPLSTYLGLVSFAGHVVCMGGPLYHNAAFSQPNYLAFTTHPEMDYMGVQFVEPVTLTSFYATGFGNYKVRLYSQGVVVYTTTYTVLSSRVPKLITLPYGGTIDAMRITVVWGSSTIGIDDLLFTPEPVWSAHVTLWSEGGTTMSEVDAASVGSLTIGPHSGALVEFFKMYPGSFVILERAKTP